MYQTDNEAGFTLIEMLIVLSIVSLILSIMFIDYSSRSDEQSFDTWYQQFELDLLYSQKYTMVTRQVLRLSINRDSNSYSLRNDGSSPALITRKIPEDWDVRVTSVRNPISFTRYGQIVGPGSISVRTKNARYSITFPFGKSRSYYVKSE